MKMRMSTTFQYLKPEFDMFQSHPLKITHLILGCQIASEKHKRILLRLSGFGLSRINRRFHQYHECLNNCGLEFSPLGKENLPSPTV